MSISLHKIPAFDLSLLATSEPKTLPEFPSYNPAHLRVSYHETSQGLCLGMLRASSDAPKGTGTAFMAALCAYADARGLVLLATPSRLNSKLGGWKTTSSLTRLEKWYRGFGFKPKSGARDYRPQLSESFFRDSK